MRIGAGARKISGKWVRQVAPSWADRRFLARRYHDFTGRWPDLRHPKSYREKLLWLNLYYRDPLIPVLSDKLLAREEVARRVGPGPLIDLLGVWDDPGAIPFDRLPEQFVLKATAGSAQNCFCWDRSRFDIAAAVAKLRGWLGEDYSDRYREWCYRPLKPRIIAERLMVDPLHPDRSPDDLKIHCFNGQPKLIKWCSDRRGNRQYASFDPQWNRMDLGLSNGKGCANPPAAPAGLGELLEIARKLSAGFPYVRVDLYWHQGRAVFGEMTWFPFAGNVPMESLAVDRMMGDWIDLPTLRRRWKLPWSTERPRRRPPTVPTLIPG